MPPPLALSLCILTVLAATSEAVLAEPIEDFYKGRQIRFVIGSNSGGS